MAVSLASDFAVYNEEFQGGFIETLEQNTAAFNAASRNGLMLATESKKGHYEKEAFWQNISGLVSRRDITSSSAATPAKLTQGEFVSVKMNRKIGPVDSTIDAFKKIAEDPSVFSFILGQMAANGIAVDMVNTGLKALRAAIEGQSAAQYDATGESTTTMTHSHLVQGLAKFGDQAGRITCWVFHSKPWFDLIGQAITDKVFEIGAMAIYAGSTPTLGRPAIVIDSPSLIATTPDPDEYWTLGLTPQALEVIESEERTVVVEPVTGLEQLVMRLQGEFAYNLGVKGFQWDVTNGGANPTDAALATTTNWDKVLTDIKSTAGVAVITT